MQDLSVEGLTCLVGVLQMMGLSEEVLDHYYIILTMVVMVEQLLECQAKVSNHLVRNFPIILTNTETLPCRILRERTDWFRQFCKKRRRKELKQTQFYAKLKNVSRSSDPLSWHENLFWHIENLREKKTKLSSLRKTYSSIVFQAKINCVNLSS